MLTLFCVLIGSIKSHYSKQFHLNISPCYKPIENPLSFKRLGRNKHNVLNEIA